ncbi:MAG: hypothetical protein F4239_04670 [Gammaproteobacteria bacterium]|nr:hypothetical protein [Gammaproteobacteria bacterium]
MGGGSGHTALHDVALLSELAEKHETTVYQVVLAWLLQKGENILPIPGASRISSAVSSAHAVHIQMSDADIQRIDGLGAN